MNFIKRLYHTEVAHNASVDQHIQTVHQLLDEAQSSAELQEALQAQNPDASLRFKNRLFWLLMLSYIVVAPLTLIAVIGLEIDWLSWTVGILCAVLFFALLSRYRNSKPYDALLHKALRRQEELRYGFRYGAEQQAHSHEQIKEDFAHAFQRGNYDNSIPRFASGRYTEDQLELEYTVFNYHYVNRRKEVYYEKGRRKERVVYDHFDRWGLFFGGVKPVGVAITSEKNRVYPEAWDTASIEFNRRHYITGVNEIELARLFQPVNILMFEKFFAPYKEFDLQFSDRLPLLYWGFNVDPFQRSMQAGQPKTIGELAALLPSVQLKQFEFLRDSLQPILEKVVN